MFTFLVHCSTLIPPQICVLRATLCVPAVRNTNLELKSKISLFLSIRGKRKTNQILHPCHSFVKFLCRVRYTVVYCDQTNFKIKIGKIKAK